MAEHKLQETVALLSRTPATLDALLRGQPDIWTRRNEGESSWSAFDVVGHLIEGERTDWIPRARMILESGESETFKPFDRFAHARQNQGKVVQEKSMDGLLEEFNRLRTQNLVELSSMRLQPDQLNRCGRQPSFGTVTLGQLLATWAMHDMTHLHQLTRIMAFQYRETVGPWSKFLGVMHCNGHSAD